MHISFAVFADAANVSQEGKLNVLGIFDALQVGGFPSVHPRTHFVARLKGAASEAGDHTLAFRWLNPRGDELWSSAGELHLQAGPNQALDMELPVIAVVDLPLDVGGPYLMQLLLDGAPTAEVRLFVSGPPPVMPVTTGLMS